MDYPTFDDPRHVAIWIRGIFREIVQNDDTGDRLLRLARRRACARATKTEDYDDQEIAALLQVLVDRSDAGWNQHAMTHAIGQLCEMLGVEAEEAEEEEEEDEETCAA